MKKQTLPVALIQERNHGDAEANLSVIEQRVAEAARRGVAGPLRQRVDVQAHEQVAVGGAVAPAIAECDQRIGRARHPHGDATAAQLRHSMQNIVGSHGNVLHTRATLGPAIVLVLSVIIFSIVADNFLQPGNISLIIQQVMPNRLLNTVQMETI